MAEVTAEKNEQIAKMNFRSIYPHYLNRIEKHGRTKEELDRVIMWLTGYEQNKLDSFIIGKGPVYEIVACKKTLTFRINTEPNFYILF